MADKPTKEEIEDQANEAIVRVAENDLRFPGSSYEAGVQAALQWVLGEGDEPPLAD